MKASEEQKNHSYSFLCITVQKGFLLKFVSQINDLFTLRPFICTVLIRWQNLPLI